MKLVCDIDLQDAASAYDYSLKHFNACYDFFCKYESNPALVDLVEAIIAHTKAQHEAEQILLAHGVAKEDIQKVVYTIVNQDNDVL